MTLSQRTVLTGVFVACLALVAALPAPAEQQEAKEPPIQMITTNVQGKNVYIPGTIVMVAGQPRTIQIFNTTDTPHGFSITEAGVQEVLPPGEEHVVEVKALPAGVYRMFCHLHPAHRGGQLLVVETPE